MSIPEEGTARGSHDTSFHKIDNTVPLNELLILVHIEQEDGKPLPVGMYTERSIGR